MKVTLDGTPEYSVLSSPAPGVSDIGTVTDAVGASSERQRHHGIVTLVDRQRRRAERHRHADSRGLAHADGAARTEAVLRAQLERVLRFVGEARHRVRPGLRIGRDVGEGAAGAAAGHVAQFVRGEFRGGQRRRRIPRQHDRPVARLRAQVARRRRRGVVVENDQGGRRRRADGVVVPRLDGEDVLAVVSGRRAIGRLQRTRQLCRCACHEEEIVYLLPVDCAEAGHLVEPV